MVGVHGHHGGSQVSEFWRVVGGIQQLVARDGGSSGRGGGGGGGTDRGVVLGPGHAKEEDEPGGDLAVGKVTPEGGRRKVMVPHPNHFITTLDRARGSGEEVS